MGHRSEDYATPIVRGSLVALKEPDRYMLDGFVFPGNSGGPVIYMPSLLGNMQLLGGVQLSNIYMDKQMLIGVISSYIPYKDIAVSLQTNRPRIIFEENSGLCYVIPSKEIIKLINSEDVKQFEKSLK